MLSLSYVCLIIDGSSQNLARVYFNNWFNRENLFYGALAQSLALLHLHWDVSFWVVLAMALMSGAFCTTFLLSMYVPLHLTWNIINLYFSRMKMLVNEHDHLHDTFISALEWSQMLPFSHRKLKTLQQRGAETHIIIWLKYSVWYEMFHNRLMTKAGHSPVG